MEESSKIKNGPSSKINSTPITTRSTQLKHSFTYKISQISNDTKAQLNIFIYRYRDSPKLINKVQKEYYLQVTGSHFFNSHKTHLFLSFSLSLFLKIIYHLLISKSLSLSLFSPTLLSQIRYITLITLIQHNFYCFIVIIY